MTPALRERWRSQGMDVTPSEMPEQFGAYIRNEVARFSKVIREAGIKPE